MEAAKAFYLVVVTPEPLAMFPQHGHLVAEGLRVARRLVRRVASLHDQPERLALAAADEDRRVWPLHRRRVVHLLWPSGLCGQESPAGCLTESWQRGASRSFRRPPACSPVKSARIATVGGRWKRCFRSASDLACGSTSPFSRTSWTSSWRSSAAVTGTCSWPGNTNGFRSSPPGPS